MFQPSIYMSTLMLFNGTHCIQNVHPSYSNGNKRVLTVIVRGGLCISVRYISCIVLFSSVNLQVWRPSATPHSHTSRPSALALWEEPLLMGPMRWGKHFSCFCFSAVSNFPLMAQIALITQTLTTRLTRKGPPAKNETDCFRLTVQQRHQGLTFSSVI